MRHETIQGSGALDRWYRMPALPMGYSGETDPIQRLFAHAYLQVQRARQQTEAERQTDADCQAAVIATQRHIAEAHLSPEQCLEFIVYQARLLTRADGAAIALSDGSDFICRGRSGELAPDPGARVDRQSGISGACLRTGEAQQCDDTETDPRVAPSVCRGQGMRSILAVPVRRADVVGILAVFSGWAGAFSERDVRTLSLLAALVVAQLPQDAPEVARVADAQPAQAKPDTTEALHAAEFTAQRDAELLPAAFGVREAPARRGWRSLRSAVLALAVLVITSEAVVWRGLHVKNVFRVAKVFFATLSPGATPHPSTSAITLPTATARPAQTILKTVPEKTPSPASAADRTRARPPGEKSPLALSKTLPQEGPEPSVIANPPSARLEGPVNVRSLFAGFDSVVQPDVINPKASTSLPTPKDASNVRENAKRALEKHKKAESRAQLQQVLEFRGLLKDRYINVRRVVGVRFAIYAQPQGGVPLWQEVQDVEVDELGSFSARVGSNSGGGFPAFAVESPLWLGWLVQLPGEVERPRIWLVSTPSGLMADGAIARIITRDSADEPTSEPRQSVGRQTDGKKIKPD